jgi:very-short-patch-repair endonuclease
VVLTVPKYSRITTAKSGGAKPPSQNGTAVRRKPDMTWLSLRASDLRNWPTPEEALLWDRLSARIWEFQKPMILKGARGKVWPLIADFYHDDGKLIIELDGRQHEKHKGHDARRDRACQFNGIKVLRFTNKRIHKELDKVIAEIAAAVEERS